MRPLADSLSFSAKGSWRRRITTLALGGFGALVVLALIGFYLGNLKFLSDQATTIVMLSRLDVSLPDGASEVIGRQELMQAADEDSAEPRHIRLSNANGTVMLRNVARQRRAFLTYGNNYASYASRWKLQAGDRISLGGARLIVEIASPRSLSFTIDGRRVEAEHLITENTVSFDGHKLETCKVMDLKDRAHEIFARLFASGERLVFFLGGRITCKIGGQTHLSLPGAPWRGLAIIERKDGWYLAPGDPPGAVVPAFRIERGQFSLNSFAEIEWPVTAPASGWDYGRLTQITIGRTVYRIEVEPEKNSNKVNVALIPDRRIHRFEFDDALAIPNTPTNPRIPTNPKTPTACPEPKAPAAGQATAGTPEVDEVFRWQARTGVSRSCAPPHRVMTYPENLATVEALDWKEQYVRRGVIGVAMMLILFGLFERFRTLLSFRRARLFLAPALSLMLVAIIFLATAAPELVLRRDVDMSLNNALALNAAAWFAVTIMLFTLGGVRLEGAIVWISLLALVLFGALTQFSLALDAPTTRWVIQVQKHKLMFLDLVPLVIAAIAIFPSGRLTAALRVFAVERTPLAMLCRTAPAYLVLGLLVLWLFVGDEQGAYGFQPIEFGKISVIVILALLAVGLRRIDVFAKERSKRSLWVLSMAVLVPTLVLAFAAWQFGTAGMDALLTLALSNTYLAGGLALLVTLGFWLLGYVGRADYSAWIATTLATLVIFGAALVAVPLLKSDLSPLLIMTVVSLLVFAVALAPWPVKFFVALRRKVRRRRDAPARFALMLKKPHGSLVAWSVAGGALLLTASVIAAPFAVKWLIFGSEKLPSDTVQFLDRLDRERGGSYRVPIERTMTWYDLDHSIAAKDSFPLPTPPRVRYPDLGFQVLRSKEALAHASCGFSGLQLGLAAAIVRPFEDFLSERCLPWKHRSESAPSYGTEDLVRVPVIQNDFIGTYILGRFGLATGLVIFFLQGLALGGLAVLAMRLHPPATLDAGLAAVRRFLSICIAGVVALLGCQWGISWCNILGLLPVMGQPMTFAAAATSHHLLLGLPVIALALLAIRVVDNPPIRISRSPPG